MRGNGAFDDTPGRRALGALAAACRNMGKGAFLATYQAPFLIQMTETAEKATSFATIAPEAHQAATTLGLYAYQVAKRPGANAFTQMITLGRTRNNDIIVEEGSVSKYHANFKKEASGRWTLTDVSTNGVRVDGAKIPKDKPIVLHSGARLVLADGVELLYLEPSDALDHLQRVKT